VSKAVRRVLSSVDLRRCVETGQLPGEILPGTAILYTLPAKPFGRSILTTTKPNALGQHVYLRKGCFLIPIAKK